MPTEDHPPTFVEDSAGCLWWPDGWIVLAGKYDGVTIECALCERRFVAGPRIGGIAFARVKRPRLARIAGASGPMKEHIEKFGRNGRVAGCPVCVENLA